jgi:biopolymer transport protein ExbB
MIWLLLGWTLLAGPDLSALLHSQVFAQESKSLGTVSEGIDGADASGANSPELPKVSGSESFLAWMVRASGPIGLVIAVMSFYLIALVVWMALRYRTAIAIPRPLVRELHELLEQGKYTEAYHRLIADDSLLARILAAGVRKLPVGLPTAHRAMELANEEATMEMEHRTTYLATVGTLGPMIGLVGTVYGMIMAFRVIALEGSSPQASDLARGISTALFATLEGIAISIPAIFFYSMFRNRIARLSLEVAMGAEPLLERFVPGVHRQEPGAAQAAQQPKPQPQPPVPVPRPIVGPPLYPHPFAVSAALEAASSVGTPRSALPSAPSESP